MPEKIRGTFHVTEQGLIFEIDGLLAEYDTEFLERQLSKCDVYVVVQKYYIAGRAPHLVFPFVRRLGEPPL
jgi:hypothetical protein